MSEATTTHSLRRIEKVESEEDKLIAQRRAELPPLDECLNLYDFEALAKGVMSKQAWAYYSSGADDEITMRENRSAYQRLWFRPRILRDVSKIDYSTTLLGVRTSMPMCVASRPPAWASLMTLLRPADISRRLLLADWAIPMARRTSPGPRRSKMSSK